MVFTPVLADEVQSDCGIHEQFRYSTHQVTITRTSLYNYISFPDGYRNITADIHGTAEINDSTGQIASVSITGVYNWTDQLNGFNYGPVSQFTTNWRNVAFSGNKVMITINLTVYTNRLNPNTGYGYYTGTVYYEIYVY